MILSPSGGLVYHTRAAFNQKNWSATRQTVSRHVGKWLEATNSSQLIVFGPSAAYLLDSDVFSKLAAPGKLMVVDPDNIARLIFKRRFRQHPVEWTARADVLPFSSAEDSTFSNFIERWPEAPILFHGVLGQIELHGKQAARGRAKARSLLLKALERRNWMSVHDAASAELSATLEMDLELAPASAAEPLETSLQRVSMDLQTKHGVDATSWIDHDTGWIGRPETLIPWRLHPRRLHLLAVVSGLKPL